MPRAFMARPCRASFCCSQSAGSRRARLVVLPRALRVARNRSDGHHLLRSLAGQALQPSLTPTYFVIRPGTLRLAASAPAPKRNRELGLRLLWFNRTLPSDAGRDYIEMELIAGRVLNRDSQVRAEISKALEASCLMPGPADFDGSPVRCLRSSLRYWASLWHHYGHNTAHGISRPPRVSVARARGVCDSEALLRNRPSLSVNAGLMN